MYFAALMKTRTVGMTLVILVSLILGKVAAENSALLKSDRQKITSSTLKWVTPNGESIPHDAVVGSVDYIPIGIKENELNSANITDRQQIKEKKIYVCRTRLNGNWLPGALHEGTRACIVSLVVRVYQQNHYEVLQNVDQAARVVWKDWEWNVDTPNGAVLAGDLSSATYYIAHAPSPGLRIYSENLAIGMAYQMGKIDPSEGVFGKLSVVDEHKNVINDVNEGQVLVEIEPRLYELTITRLTKAREKVINQTPLVLGEMTLRNNLQQSMKVDSVISYQWKYDSNWGPGKAMLKGLNTTIYFANSSHTERIRWGTTLQEVRDEVVNLEAELDAGTATHVIVRATLFELEVPYTGNLLSVFHDATTMNRTIHGTWLRTVLVDIESEYGPAYYLHNNSVVPTTTTTTAAPTTTTATTTSESIGSANVDEPLQVDKTKNKSDTLPLKDEISNNSLNEDNPLQLPNKDESDKHDSANLLSLSSTCFAVSILLTILERPILLAVTT